MAKGDRGDVNNAITQYGTSGFNQTNAMQPQYQNMYNNASNNYNQSWNQGMGNYNNIMQGYGNFLGGGAMGPGSNYQSNPSNYGGSGGGISFNPNNAIPNSGISGYGNFGGANGMPNPGLGGSGSSGGGGQGDPTGFQKAWFASGGKTVDDLKNFVAANPQYGATISGSKGSKLTFPGGQAFQAVRSAGLGGGIGPAWDDLSGGGGGGGGGGYPGAVNSALAGYGDFAQTGGFSPQAIQDIRARNVAASRAAFQTGQDELSRERALSGGNMPNYAAAQAKMTREQANSAADINTNTDAGIAQMVQQGRLAGLGGLSQTGLLGQGQNLAALQGMTGLYGTAPGPAGLAQSGMLGASGQQLQQQQLANQMGLGLIGSRLAATQVPSNWQQFMQTWGPVISGGIGAVL